MSSVNLSTPQKMCTNWIYIVAITVLFGTEAIFSSPCDPSPCFNDGYCHVTSNTTYRCFCRNNYFGERCQNNAPGGCETLQCLNGGSCKKSRDPTFPPVCVCKDNFSGSRCQFEQCPAMNNCPSITAIDRNLILTMDMQGCREHVLNESRKSFKCAEKSFYEMIKYTHCGCRAEEASHVLVQPYLYGLSPELVTHAICRQILQRKLNIYTRCPRRTQYCNQLFHQSASRYNMNRKNNCTQYELTFHAKALECVEQALNGTLDFDGCEFQDNYMDFVQETKDRLELYCSGCPDRLIQEECGLIHSSHVAFCKSYIVYRRPLTCRNRKLREHPLCMDKAENTITVLTRMRQRYSQFHTPLCEKVVSYVKIRDKEWECPPDTLDDIYIEDEKEMSMENTTNVMNVTEVTTTERMPPLNVTEAPITNTTDIDINMFKNATEKVEESETKNDTMEQKFNEDNITEAKNTTKEEHVMVQPDSGEQGSGETIENVKVDDGIWNGSTIKIGGSGAGSKEEEDEISGQGSREQTDENEIEQQENNHNDSDTNVVGKEHKKTFGDTDSISEDIENSDSDIKEDGSDITDDDVDTRGVETKHTGSSFPWWILVIIIVVIVLLTIIILVIVVVVRKKYILLKKKKGADDVTLQNIENSPPTSQTSS